MRGADTPFLLLCLFFKARARDNRHSGAGDPRNRYMKNSITEDRTKTVQEISAEWNSTDKSAKFEDEPFIPEEKTSSGDVTWEISGGDPLAPKGFSKP